MFDLHAHILPGVDDGAETMDDAVEMARVAAKHGTSVILATPHRRDVTENFSVPHIQGLAADLSEELQRRSIDLEILIGMENHLDMELPEAFLTGQALPMNGSRYALVELPFFGYPDYTEDVLFQLQLQGITPVLAHPERIEAIQQNPELLAGFVDRGMLSQVTSGSIVGHFGGAVRKTTQLLLKRGLIHIIASDTHFPEGRRSPKLPPGKEAAARIVGEERARSMVVDTPRTVLDNLPVEVEPPQKVERPRRWWRFGHS